MRDRLGRSLWVRVLSGLVLGGTLGIRLALLPPGARWAFALVVGAVVAGLVALVSLSAARRGWRPSVTVASLGPLLLMVVTATLSCAVSLHALSRRGTGHAGYRPLPTQDGRPLARGRPLGSRCRKVRLTVQPGTPTWVSAQITSVVNDAAAHGLNVELSPPGRSGPDGDAALGVSVIWDVVDERMVHGHAQRYDASYSTGRDADGRHADLTSTHLILFAAGLHDDPSLVRKAVRMLLAETSGVRPSTAAGTGIGAHLESSADRFSRTDLEVMRSFSGC